MFDRLESINRIILSAGHGGLEGESYDPGAVHNSNKENLEVKQIISKLSPKLSFNGLVVVVLPDYGLSKTITYINAQYQTTTDWAFELHKDSTTVYSPGRMKRQMGIYFHPTSPESKPIAEEMVKEYKRQGANESSWTRPDTVSNHGRLAWIRQPKMLSHLIECGFMQDRLDDNSDEFYARMVARGICKCLERSYREN